MSDEFWQKYVPDLELIEQWKAIVDGPISAADWIGVGVRKPSSAQEWILRGLEPRTARAWKEAGFRDLDQALHWIGLEQSIGEAKSWIERNVVTPEICAGLLARGVTLELTYGLDCSALGDDFFEPWLNFEFLFPDLIWMHHQILNSWIGVSAPEEAAIWIQLHVDSEQARVFESFAVSPQLVSRLNLGLYPERLTTHLEAGRVNSEELLLWVNSGLEIEELIGWISCGVIVKDALLWKSKEINGEHAKKLAGLGITPKDWENHQHDVNLGESQIDAWISSGLPKSEVRNWIFAGFPEPGSALKWFISLEVSAKKSTELFNTWRGNLRKAKMSLEIAATQKILERNKKAKEKKLQTQEESRSLQPQSSKYSFASDEWLEEIIARALTVQPKIRKVGYWPSRLILNEGKLEVEISLMGDQIIGRVVDNRQILNCSFSSETFVSAINPSNSIERFALGVCICWFIDCSITISQGLSGRSKLFEVSNGASIGKQEKITYTPTPIYERNYASPNRGMGRVVVRHKVSGHIRKLADGRNASPSAKSNAPNHVRKNIKMGETFVRPHFRGTEEERRRLIQRLSKHSAIADALSDLGI